jgi:sulfopropanediol 3-dehydrogenase
VIEYIKQAPLYSRQVSAQVRDTVSEMLARIERDREQAIRHYSRELDGWDPPSFLVDDATIARAGEQVDEKLKQHIAFAQRQVRGFAEAQHATLRDLEVETLPGVTLGHRHIPVQAVGSYVPGGRYPMLASSFMTVIVPKVAGVDRVVACAPPRKGEGIHPEMLYAMSTSSADSILALGGVQALAAMVHGIEDLPPADIIVGAGNAYVAEAKRQLFGEAGIDLLAGPTEVAIIADRTAEPELLAIDLLGQAEHGPTSPAVLISTDRALGEAVLEQIERLLTTYPTREVAAAAWEAHGSVAIVADLDEAIALSDEIASEHLEVQVEESLLDHCLQRLRNYGSLFLGREATVAYGDKAVGTNHVLPTQRAARYTGGLWVGKFLKTCTWQRLTPEGTRTIAPAVAAISHAEMLEGHALTASYRLDHPLAASAEPATSSEPATSAEPSASS